MSGLLTNKAEPAITAPVAKPVAEKPEVRVAAAPARAPSQASIDKQRQLHEAPKSELDQKKDYLFEQQKVRAVNDANDAKYAQEKAEYDYLRTPVEPSKEAKAALDVINNGRESPNAISPNTKAELVKVYPMDTKNMPAPVVVPPTPLPQQRAVDTSKKPVARRANTILNEPEDVLGG